MGNSRASERGTGNSTDLTFFFFQKHKADEEVRRHIIIMKKYLIACFACLALLTTSCGVSRQATGNSNVTQTEVVLAKKNYKVVGMAHGESSQNYWFGIGGLSKKSLGESAMSDMYKNANLKDSQAIINVNVSYKNKFVLIYSGTKAIATGTIIEFTE